MRSLSPIGSLLCLGLLIACSGGDGERSTAPDLDCRRDGIGCTAPFECLADENEIFDCRRPEQNDDESREDLDCRNEGRECAEPFVCAADDQGEFTCVMNDMSGEDAGVDADASQPTEIETIVCEDEDGIVYTPPLVFEGQEVTVNTLRGANESQGSCGGQGSAELVVAFDVSETLEAFLVDTFFEGTEIPTTLYVRKEECLNSEAEVACIREDYRTNDPGQTLTVPFPEEGRYYIFVDGVGSAGQVTLKVTTQKVAECKNQLDDDGDGLIDYPSDPGCTRPTDRSETNEGALSVCANQSDDDGDGLTDFPADPGCIDAAWTSEDDVCGEDVFLTRYFDEGGAISDSTDSASASNRFDPPPDCGLEEQPERAYFWRNEYRSQVTIRTDYSETAILTAVYVLPFVECMMGSIYNSCAAGNGMLEGTSSLVLEALEPGDYLVVVDTASGDPGSFRLSIEAERIRMECNDGVDNDEDGFIDDDDQGCASRSDRSERDYAFTPDCDNGLDDDGDGRIDYPFDPGCETRGGTDESREGDLSEWQPACLNGLDDDGDGLVDIPFDPGCSAFGDDDETDLDWLPQCANGRDDDGDGLRDFPDDLECDFAGDRRED